MSQDPELLNFSQQAIEHLGGVAESDNGHLLAFLPSDLVQELNLPEEAKLGHEQGVPLIYGSPILDRLIDLTTKEIPLAYGQIKIPYLKKQGFEQVLEKDFGFPGARVSITNSAKTRATYMILVCQYIALSDERKEGLVQIGIQEQNGAVVKGLEELYREHEIEYFQSGKVPPHFPNRSKQGLKNGLQAVQEAVSYQLSDFQKSMQRRLQRDVRNLKEYYQALSQEMKDSLNHPNLSQNQKEERMAKIEELPKERDQKILDLEHKYNIQVNIKGAAVLRILMDVVQLNLVLNYKKWKKNISLTWNPVTRRLDPLTCSNCGNSIRSCYFQVEADNLRLLCAQCS